jgi:anti-sigma-K factor RskA
MSDDDTIGAGDHGDLLAAEYVLGVLSPEARRSAELRLEREPGFAAEVSFWEARLGGLADGVTPVTPPAELWPRIEARIAATPSPERRPGLWHSLAFWRTFAVSSAALAAASIAALIYVAEAPRVGPPLLARLDQPSGQPEFLAAANPADGSVTVVPAVLITGQQQRAYELWVIPPGGTPHSLGLVDPERPVKVVVPPELLPHVSADSTLAITLEPPGGSPTGKPTGPVIANGKLASL